MSILDKLLGDPAQKVLNKFQTKVRDINALEEEIQKLKDTDFPKKTKELQELIAGRLSQISDLEKRKRVEAEVLNETLPQAFALVREAAKRTLGQRHYDVQLLGGMVLHSGKIAEMKTGEGKTLVATLPAYLNALAGHGVHIVTVNDYLAKRDAQWMGSVYDFLGLKVGIIQQENKSYVFEKSGPIDLYGEANLRQCTKKEAYGADVTYGTNNEFGFDYLRDNMVQDLSQMAQREELYYAIVDEVDSILIDEARTPLIISAPAEESGELYRTFSGIVPRLKESDDYTVDEKMRAVSITEAGISKVEAALGVGDLYSGGRVDLVHHLEQALKAHALFKLDKDYVVREGEVIIIDEFTGRMLHGRRYSEGLHQAIEAKEGVAIKRESVTLATITFQNYFRLYEKLAGMTGTALTQAEEFSKVYKIDVVAVPTNKQLIRKDLPDQIYKTEKAKFEAVARKVAELHHAGHPVLVGTVSIEKNELLSQLFKKHKIPHNILNAKNHESEAAIITDAGRKGSVTVATNMAGRGVDIILGGALSPQEQANPKLAKKWQAEHEEIKRLGGLYVIGTQRHESRRIDNQLRGRAGRQGDPGVTQFFVSLEDDLMRIFGSERIKGMLDRLGLPDEEAIEHKMISNALEGAQKKVEGHNFDTRKHLLEYDDVLNKHREVVYKLRRKVLASKNLKEDILDLVAREITAIVSVHTASEVPEEWNLEQVANDVANIMPLSPEDATYIKQPRNPEETEKYLIQKAEKLYEQREKEFGMEVVGGIERAIYLRYIDTLWVEHLEAMEALKESIGLRGYAQRDPLIEYKQEGFNMFERLMAEIEAGVVGAVFKVKVERGENDKEQVTSEKGMNDSQAEQQEGEVLSRESGVASRERNKKDQVSNISTQISNLKSLPAQQATKSPAQFSQETAITRGREQMLGEGQVTKKHKIGRNDPCPCGAIDPNTGKPKKYKRCHGR